ncbi:MAG TPA: acylphosphatase [Burkholderiales bacterium]|nr:acylphosphatase [Burkholderiales bacterium]
MIARHLVVRGRVQGVGFRFHMRAEAVRLGVSGWVRNRSDGTVEALVQGDQGSVDRLIAWTRRGPSSAQVTDLEIEERAPAEFDGFASRPTE